jgi:casein kinase 1
MDNPINKDLTNYTIAKSYKLIKRIGSGAFGEIYLVLNKATKEEFAMKLERSDTKHPQLFFEAKLYHYLNTEKDDKGLPRAAT